MILKDRFLTQSAPNICHELQKQAVGPNQSLKNFCNWLRWYITVENLRRKIGGKKRPGKIETPAWLLDLLWNSLRKKCPEGHRWKGMGLLLLWRGHLKQDCPQASKPPPAPCPICKGPYWRRDCPPKCRSQGSDSQGNQDWWFPGGPHTSSHSNYTWGTLGINNYGGPINRFPFGQLSLCSLKPLVRFPPNPLL